MLRAGGDEPARAAVALDLEPCRNLLPDASRECWTREFLAAVEGQDDPRPAVAAIADAAREEGGFLLSSCHGLMHTVGRTYAREAGVTLAGLMDYLPRSNDPGCSAGFAHGLVTGVGAQIDPRRPGRGGGGVQRGPRTRYQRYSCVHGLGHAFMRIHGDRLPPALALCRALGQRLAADCAQGAYHDYWFAVVGADEASLPEGATTDPRRLCGAQPTALVRPCWYRAFVDNRPEGIVVDSPEHLDVLCEGLEGLQREACVTGAAVIGPADPAVQLELCAGLHDPSDAAGCIRGTKAQNLLGSSGLRLRPADRPLRALRRRDPLGVLPLAGEGDRGAHRRRVRAERLPETRESRCAAQLPCRRAHDGGGTRHVQLSASIDAVSTIPSTLRASSASRVMKASACSCVSAMYSAS